MSNFQRAVRAELSKAHRSPKRMRVDNSEPPRLLGVARSKTAPTSDMTSPEPGIVESVKHILQSGLKSQKQIASECGLSYLKDDQSYSETGREHTESRADDQRSNFDVQDKFQTSDKVRIPAEQPSSVQNRQKNCACYNRCSVLLLHVKKDITCDILQAITGVLPQSIKRCDQGLIVYINSQEECNALLALSGLITIAQQKVMVLLGKVAFTTIVHEFRATPDIPVQYVVEALCDVNSDEAGRKSPS